MKNTISGTEGNNAKKIVAEAKAKAMKAGEELLEEIREEEALKKMTFIEMRNTPNQGTTGFERSNREIKKHEGPPLWKWLISTPKTIEELSANNTGKRFFGGFFDKGFVRLKGMERLNRSLTEKAEAREGRENIDLTSLIEIVDQVFKRAIGSKLLRKIGQERIPLIQETVSQEGDRGWGWSEWKKSPLGMALTTPQTQLQQSAGAAYDALDAWSRLTGSLAQRTEEAPGLGRFFLPKRFPLKEIGKQSLFDSDGNPQSLKIWQPWLSKETPLPLEGIRKPREEKFTGIEVNEVTQKPRSRIYDEIFRISPVRGEFDRGRDSVEKSIHEAAEAAKGAKKEEKDALLARIMEIKSETEEIKKMIKHIKQKDSESIQRERIAPKLNLTTSSEESEWDELREEVMKGLLPR